MRLQPLPKYKLRLTRRSFFATGKVANVMNDYGYSLHLPRLSQWGGLVALSNSLRQTWEVP